MNKLEQLKDRMVAYQTGDMSKYEIETSLGLLLSMHIEELENKAGAKTVNVSSSEESFKEIAIRIDGKEVEVKPATVKVSEIKSCTLKDYDGKYSDKVEINVDWQAECGVITKQHDEALNKVKEWKKYATKLEKDYVESKLKESNATRQHEAALEVVQNLTEENDRLKRGMEALEKVKCVQSICPGVGMYEICGKPLEDYVDEYDNMKKEIEKLTKQIDAQNFSMSIQKGFNNSIVEKNNKLQEFAQIGRVFKWYHTKCDKILMANFGRTTSRIKKFEMTFEAIEKLYREDPNNEAF